MARRPVSVVSVGFAQIIIVVGAQACEPSFVQLFLAGCSWAPCGSKES